MVTEVKKEMEDCGNGANRNNSSSDSSPGSTVGLNMGVTWRPSADLAFGVYQRPTVNVSGGSLRSSSLRLLERKSVCSQWSIPPLI